MFSVYKMLDQECYNKNISRRRLVKGICSPQLLIKASEQDTNIELLTFEILMERIGRSPENLEFILSDKEYSSVTIRDNIDNYIYNQDYLAAEDSLNTLIPNLNKASLAMKMYYYRIHAWISSEKGDLLSAKESIMQAIYTTLPDITISNYEQYCFSSYELENILFLSELLFKYGDIDTAISITSTVYEWSKKHITDSRLLVSILPKCALLFGRYCQNNLPIEKIRNYIEEAIDLMRNESIIYMMSPLLTMLINIYQSQNEPEKASYWMPFRDVINELLNKYIPSIPQDSIFFRCRKVSYNLESEILKAERVRQSLSQLDLSDGVYSNPSSISYYETNKRSPNKTTFTKLMDKFNLNKPKRSGFVLTESFDRLELFQKMREYANKQDYSALLDLINNSSEYDYFEEPIITAYKCFASKNSKHEYDSETIEKIASIIDQRYPLSPQAQYRKPFLEECYLICTYLGLPQHKHEYLLTIYENIINHIEQSAISPKYSYFTYTSLAMNYIYCVGKYMSYDAVTSICDKALYYTLLCGNSSCLSGLFWAKVHAFHRGPHSDINNSEKAYLFSELYKEKLSTILKNYYFQWCQVKKE